jgi:hypothetical protein
MRGDLERESARHELTALALVSRPRAREEPGTALGIGVHDDGPFGEAVGVLMVDGRLIGEH